MNKVKSGIDSGSIPLLREERKEYDFRSFMEYMEEETEKKTPEREFHTYKSDPEKKGPSQLGGVTHDALTILAAKYFGPKVVEKKKLNEMECPPGIKKIRYKGTLRRKDMMVCPRRSGSSSGGDGGNGN